MKPQSSKGTRDFNAIDVRRRNHIIGILKDAFETFAFNPLETPSFENIETLMGKYGEEGDRLIFKILRSGDYMKNVEDSSNPKIREISDKALRYDLTVPFARYVSQNAGKLSFPFKRYQIQPVWRADRPQKGRFREFLQCDADVVGSSSLWQEVEMIDLYSHVFDKLNLSVKINLNNRKILSGIATVCGVGNRLIEFTVALDKLDKIGEVGVISELRDKGFSEKEIDDLKPALRPLVNFDDSILFLKDWLNASDEALEGIKELEFIVKNIRSPDLLRLNISLARGLNYYTGCIIEVSAADVEIGSIGGGGRYDNLTSMFGLDDISGVGISFGLDRILLCLEELNLLPNGITKSVNIVVIRTSEDCSIYTYGWTQELRQNGISVDYYPEVVKQKKQYEYAEKIGATYVLLADEVDMKQDHLRVKNLKTGHQDVVSSKNIVSFFQNIKTIN